jgi:hypothetical protein
MELSQGAHQGSITTGQGYQVQNTTGSRVYMSAMIDPACSQIQERAEKYIKASKASNIVATSHHRIFAMVQPND